MIDTTEMYLRTLYELQEEGVAPLRARIAERLAQSGPTVSETVARMGRDRLLRVHPDRRVELTDLGQAQAVRVMRRHRLAECLLTEVIGLDWEAAHAEACRWEHVMSSRVERRVAQLLGEITESPYGNPIPGLSELGLDEAEAFRAGVRPLSEVLEEPSGPVLVRRLSEFLQHDAHQLAVLRRSGVRPGILITARLHGDHLELELAEGGGACALPALFAEHIFVGER